MRRSVHNLRSYFPVINIPVLLRIMGLLLVIEAAFLLVPLATCLIYGESDWKAFLITFAVTLATGSVMAFAIHPTSPSMGKRDGHGVGVFLHIRHAAVHAYDRQAAECLRRFF